MDAGGYSWWYVDALSDDGRHGFTMIAFVGSVFSPYYKFARRRGRADPENHCAINVALYGASGHQWAMTERGHTTVRRSDHQLVIGPSALMWDGSGLTIEVDEWTVPFARRIKGKIRIHPSATLTDTFALDAAGRHLWTPIAPLSRVDVDLDHPGLKWSGSGYFDHNRGTEPLETAFQSWNWSRTAGEAQTRILYDVAPRSGHAKSIAIAIDSAGRVTPFEPPPVTELPGTLWRIARATRNSPGSEAKIVETLEDTPFYARSLVRTGLGPSQVTMFHESLNLDRFDSPIVQFMLPFRMPRRARL